MTPRFLIHPGYPKCGSTTIQSMFKQHDDLSYIYGYPTHDLPPDTEDLGNFGESMRYGTSPTELKRQYEGIVLPQLREDRINIFSEEGMFFGDRPFQDPLKDMHNFMPEAHVLIVLRPQIDLLRSYYDMKPYLRDDPKQTFLTFSNWLRGALENRDVGLAQSLRFVDAIENSRGLFGNDNVTVVTMGRFFREIDTRTQVLQRLNLDTEQAEKLLSGQQQNSASDFRFLKIARRVLGPVRASWFLKPNQIKAIGRLMNRTIPDRNTQPSDADITFVHSVFAGQEISDLAALNDQQGFHL